MSETYPQQAGEKHSPAPGLYRWFWSNLHELTKARSMSAEDTKKYHQERALASFRRVKKQMSDFRELLSDVEKAAELVEKTGGRAAFLRSLLIRVNRPLAVVDTVANFSADAGEAALEVQRQVSAWYRDAYRGCAEKGPHDETVCLAMVDRLWQARNVKHVLGTQEGSFVRRVLEKWQHRIKMMMLPV